MCIATVTARKTSGITGAAERRKRSAVPPRIAPARRAVSWRVLVPRLVLAGERLAAALIAVVSIPVK
jgi:hypothetical protein